MPTPRQSRQILVEHRQITAARRETSRTNLEAAKQEARKHTRNQKWQYRQDAKDQADALSGDLSAIEFLSNQYASEEAADPVEPPTEPQIFPDGYYKRSSY